MSGLYDAYETDKDAEENGAPVAFRGGVVINVRADSSRKVRNWINLRAKTRRRLYLANPDGLPPEISDREDVDLAAEAVVAGWQDVKDRAGNPLPFTVENAKKLFTDLPHLRDEVLQASRMAETFRVALLKDAAGNSEPSSNASSGSAV